MRDQQDGDAVFFSNLSNNAVQLSSQWRVQAARRFVQQQNARRPDQRARDGAPLLLSAGKLVWVAALDVVKVEALHHLFDAAMPFETRPAVQRKFEVFSQRHVREQRVALKNVAAMTAAWRQAYAGCAVEENLVIQQDATLVRASESGNGIERQCLSRAAGSEEDGDSRPGAEIQIQREGRGAWAGRELFSQFRAQHGDQNVPGARPPRGRAATRLANHRMAKETAETTSTSVRASAPFPDSTAS